MEQEIELTEQQVAINQNKCSGCGANMVFDIESGGLKCRHCGSKQEFNDTESVERRRLCDELLRTHKPWTDGKVFQCSNCGAKEVLEIKSIARKCAFCGSAQIIEINELPGIQPDSVIPFQVTEAAATERFRKWIRARWMAPAAFRRSSDMREHMNKLYTPCWSFSARTTNQYSGTVGRTVHTQVRTRNGVQTRSHVRWFRVSGMIGADYNDHMYQSGDRINSRNFNGLKPFDLKQLRVYRQEYLSGIIAEHYSRTLEQCFNEFSNFVRRDVQNRIIRKHRADTVSHMDIQTTFNDRRFNYVLLPIYISHYTYKGKLFNFFINGATGKVVGRYPRSKWKIFGIVLGVLAVVAGAGVAVYFLMS